MTENQATKLLRLIRRRGIVRASEVSELGIPRKYLATLEKEGAIVKQGRGLYSLADAAVTDRHTLALACKSVPAGIVCLVSALQFHNIGTQLPFQVWLAIPSRSHRPILEYPPLRLCEFAELSYRNGIERFFDGKSEIRVYGPAKTVVDCFRFRNKIGLDVGIEALKAYLERSEASVEELIQYAESGRVSKVILPYIEALK